jgi:hypothetical protein
MTPTHTWQSKKRSGVEKTAMIVVVVVQAGLWYNRDFRYEPRTKRDECCGGEMGKRP